jgi:hypothetical protein
VLVVVDGVEGPAYEELAPGTLAFSPAGRLAYAAKKQGAWQVVADGVEGRPYTELGVLVPQGGREALAFTPGDEHVVYKALDGRTKVIIGTVGATPEYDFVFPFVVFDGPAVLTFVAGRADQVLRVEVDVPTGRVTWSNRSNSFRTGSRN